MLPIGQRRIKSLIPVSFVLYFLFVFVFGLAWLGNGDLMRMAAARVTTDSPEVENWMEELNGFDIPSWSPTADGTCVGDPAAAAEASERGWWTCGRTTRDTDITACPKQMDWGVSFDDGPSPWSECFRHLFSLVCQRAYFAYSSVSVLLIFVAMRIFLAL